MEFDAVKAWLEDHNRRQIRHRWLLAGLAFILLPFATIIGTALIYGLLFAMTHQSDRRHQLDDQPPAVDSTCLWITIGIVVAMFIVNFFIPQKKEPEKFYHEESDVPDSLVGKYVHGRKVQVKFLLWIVLTGPRLLTWAIFSLKEISRLKNQDTHSCGALLWLLVNKGGKVAYQDIPRDLEWLDVETTLAQIQELPGIVYLKHPPPGISLTDDMRTAIRQGTPI